MQLKKFLDIAEISKASGKSNSVTNGKVCWWDNSVYCYEHGACNCVSLIQKNGIISKIYRCLTCHEGAYVEID